MILHLHVIPHKSLNKKSPSRIFSARASIKFEVASLLGYLLRRTFHMESFFEWQ